LLVDISIEERETIVSYLKAYLGLHGGEMPEDEREKLESVIRKVESIPIK
jgi:hypothetical protein